MNDGTRMATHARTCLAPAPVMLNRAFVLSTLAVLASTRSCICCHPPSACTANGTASRRPDIVTASSNIFTNEEDIIPPAVQYTMATAPPIRQPSHLGIAATV